MSQENNDSLSQIVANCIELEEEEGNNEIESNISPPCDVEKCKTLPNGEFEFKQLSMKCTHCDETFCKTHDLYAHIRTHENYTTCPHCNKYWPCMVTFVYHVRTHTGEKPYYCPIKDCDFRNAVKYNLKVHLASIRHGGRSSLKKYAKILDLDVCEKSLKRRKDNSVHELTTRQSRKKKKSMQGNSSDLTQNFQHVAASILFNLPTLPPPPTLPTLPTLSSLQTLPFHDHRTQFQAPLVSAPLVSAPLVSAPFVPSMAFQSSFQSPFMSIRSLPQLPPLPALPTLNCSQIPQYCLNYNCNSSNNINTNDPNCFNTISNGQDVHNNFHHNYNVIQYHNNSDKNNNNNNVNNTATQNASKMLSPEILPPVPAVANTNTEYTPTKTENENIHVSNISNSSMTSNTSKTSNMSNISDSNSSSSLNSLNSSHASDFSDFLDCSQSLTLPPPPTLNDNNEYQKSHDKSLLLSSSSSSSSSHENCKTQAASNNQLQRVSISSQCNHSNQNANQSYNNIESHNQLPTQSTKNHNQQVHNLNLDCNLRYQLEQHAPCPISIPVTINTINAVPIPVQIPQINDINDTNNIVFHNCNLSNFQSLPPIPNLATMSATTASVIRQSTKSDFMRNDYYPHKSISIAPVPASIGCQFKLGF